jgi:hypothetical protein
MRIYQPHLVWNDERWDELLTRGQTVRLIYRVLMEGA